MNRILIVKLGALGDVVHAIPVAAALRRAFPSARIDWLVGAKHREILDLVPVIDRRLVMNDARMVAAIRELRGNHYDVAIDLQGLIKSAALARASGATRVIGFTARYAREKLASWFYTESHDPGGGGMYHIDERHVIYTNLGVLETLGIHAGVPEFPIDRVDSAVAADVSSRTNGRYAILNPGAAWPNKRWMPARFAAVASELQARHSLPSVVARIVGFGVKPAREPLARIARREADYARRAGGTRQRRTLDQPLQIDGNVVRVRAQLADGAEHPSVVHHEPPVDDGHEIEDLAMLRADEPVDAR